MKLENTISPNFTKVSGSQKEMNALSNFQRKIDMIIETELRRILDFLGLPIPEGATQESIESPMKIMGIEIKYVRYSHSPKYNGWHVYKDGQGVMILSEPRIDKKTNQIVIERIFPRDTGGTIVL